NSVSTLLPTPHSSPLFPYTTLFRSRLVGDAQVERVDLGDPGELRDALDEEGQADGRHEERDLGLIDERAQHHALGEERERVVLRSEEHTSELQSRGHLVCRLLLEKK